MNDQRKKDDAALAAVAGIGIAFGVTVAVVAAASAGKAGGGGAPPVSGCTVTPNPVGFDAVCREPTRVFEPRGDLGKEFFLDRVEIETTATNTRADGTQVALSDVFLQLFDGSGSLVDQIAICHNMPPGGRCSAVQNPGRRVRFVQLVSGQANVFVAGLPLFLTNTVFRCKLRP
jgi:hypothetical protein